VVIWNARRLGIFRIGFFVVGVDRVGSLVVCDILTLFTWSFSLCYLLSLSLVDSRIEIVCIYFV